MELQVGVKILLENKEGKFLLLKRSALKYRGGDNYWDIPGGRINPGVSLIENLQREIEEETGLVLQSEPELITVQDIFLPDKHVVRLTYSGFADGTVELSDEHTEYKWFSMDEITTIEPIDKYFKEILSKFFIE